MHRVRQLVMTACVAGAVTLAAVPGAASILLDDFETGLGGLTGTLTGSGAPPLPTGGTPPPSARETGLGLGLAPAGAGVCDHLIGGSSALCGADTLQWAGPGGALLSYAFDFSDIAAVLFDIAAFSDTDPFDSYKGEQSDIWGDFIRISTVIGGTTTLLAEFTGIPMADRETSDLEHVLVSTDAGTALRAGVVAGQSFRTMRLGLGSGLTGMGQLLFEIRSTGSSEQVGLDNIRLAPVPLPAALLLAALGLGTLGAARRVQRRRAGQSVMRKICIT